MRKYLKKIKHSANLSSDGAMESGDHFKNGARPAKPLEQEEFLIIIKR
ncbi:MAG: hypothetical protein LBK97_03115 [Prevotellaceae bacterium]|jgi:hypothetical protein|nr:hypothetical protein [Prevotellaceae bacterium]